MSNLTISPACAGVESQYLPIIRLWILRIIVRSDLGSRFLFQDGVRSKELVRFLGLSQIEMTELDTRKADRIFQQHLAAAEKRSCALPKNTILASNVRKIGQQFDLSSVEQDMLHFAYLAKACGPLTTSIDLLGGLSMGQLLRVLMLCLGHPA